MLTSVGHKSKRGLSYQEEYSSLSHVLCNHKAIQNLLFRKEQACIGTRIPLWRTENKRAWRKEYNASFGAMNLMKYNKAIWHKLRGLLNRSTGCGIHKRLYDHDILTFFLVNTMKTIKQTWNVKQIDFPLLFRPQLFGKIYCVTWLPPSYTASTTKSHI